MGHHWIGGVESPTYLGQTGSRNSSIFDGLSFLIHEEVKASAKTLPGMWLWL
jgi:hypothetical protein